MKLFFFFFFLKRIMWPKVCEAEAIKTAASTPLVSVLPPDVDRAAETPVQSPIQVVAEKKSYSVWH